MNTLEDLVRETLADRARDVDGIDLTVPRTSAGRRHRWVAIATVAAVAAAILVAVVLIAPWRDAGDRNAVGDVPTPPAGMQWVSYHGITLTVPAAWKLNPRLSCDPPPDAVFVSLGDDDGAVTVACGSFSDGPAVPQPQTTTVVSLAVLGAADPAGARTDIDGHTAYRNDSALPGGHALFSWPVFTLISIPDAGIAIHVSTTSEDALRSLLGRVEFTPVDHHGCTAQLSVDSSPQRMVGRVAVPATTGVVVCDYAPPIGTAQPWLLGSRRLTDTETTTLRDLAARARPGFINFELLLGAPQDTYEYRLFGPDGRTATLTAGAGSGSIEFDDGTHTAVVAGDRGSTLPRAYP